jgi:hypothetical protein
MHTWIKLTSDGRLRTLKYSFGQGTANTFAAQLDDDGWLVVSPAAGAPAAVLDELAADGPVRALVAPSGFHHMGHPAWRARFPDAKSYAPEGSMARLRKKSSVDYLPLAELTAQLPSRFELAIPDGLKSPDLMVRVQSGHDRVWFTGDLISNTTEADLKFFPRLIFSLFGSGPGYRFASLPAKVNARDVAAWKRAVLRAVEAAPPTIVLPAHGDPVRDDAGARTRAILA